MTDSSALLLVDDDADNRRIARAILLSAGWQVEDGAAAIAAVRAKRYALVLLDIQMPGLNGYQTAAAMRAGGGFGATVPIMAFTALRRPDTLERARAAGMDGHIAKPFTEASLIEAAAAWRTDGADPPTARLAKIFGESEIAELFQRFYGQLADALLLEAKHASLRDNAHKIAGIAGTLGFAEVSGHWHAVSEGDDASLPRARIATRKALAALGDYAPKP